MLAVDTVTTYQSIEGFGVDLATIPSPGFTDAQADQFFSVNSGIGISWCRLRASVVDGSIPGWGVPMGPVGPDGFNMSNAGLVATAQKAALRGARFWALADANTMPSTWRSGGTLIPAHYADWVAGVSQIPAQGTALGLSVELISMTNEPDFGEGWMTGAVLHTLAGSLGPLLSPSVKLMLAETLAYSNLPTFADATLTDAVTRTYVGRTATHMYSGPPTVPYGTAGTYGIPTWQAEYNQNGGLPDATIVSGLAIASAIHSCLTVGNYSMFGFFIAAGFPGWTNSRYGLLGDAFASTKRFYTFGNFSKFVRPGSIRVAATGAPPGVLASAYWTAGTNRLVVVAINTNAAPTALSVSVPSLTASSIVPWRTSSTEDLVQLTALPVTAGVFSMTLPASSVTTFVSAPAVSALKLATGAALSLNAFNGSIWKPVKVLVFH